MVATTPKLTIKPGRAKRWSSNKRIVNLLWGSKGCAEAFGTEAELKRSQNASKKHPLTTYMYGYLWYLSRLWRWRLACYCSLLEASRTHPDVQEVKNIVGKKRQRQIVMPQSQSMSGLLHGVLEGRHQMRWTRKSTLCDRPKKKHNYDKRKLAITSVAFYGNAQHNRLGQLRTESNDKSIMTSAWKTDNSNSQSRRVFFSGWRLFSVSAGSSLVCCRSGQKLTSIMRHDEKPRIILFLNWSHKVTKRTTISRSGEFGRDPFVTLPSFDGVFTSFFGCSNLSRSILSSRTHSSSLLLSEESNNTRICAGAEF